MIILFLTASLYEINSVIDFSRIVIKGLLDDNIRVGFCSLDNTDNEELGEINNLLLLDNSELYKHDWDLIIIQNSSTFISFETFINHINAPIIFICHSSNKTDKIMLHKHLFKVINVHGNIVNKDWGFPNELIDRLNFPVEISYPQQFEVHPFPYKALFINNKDDNRLETVRSIIITFGLDRAKLYSLTIYGCEINAIFENHISDNIKFVCKKDELINYIRNADVVIGSGTIAYKAIMMNKPFIVCGIRGFGGLVTPGNIKIFMKYNFEGRIGAEYYELVPPRILGEEINNIDFINSEYIKYIVCENRKLLEKYCSSTNVVNRLKHICGMTVELFNNISINQNLLQLKPKLASNIIIKNSRGNNSCYLIRNPYNKAVAIINKELIYLLSDLNGEKTLMEVLMNHKFNSVKNCELFAQMIRKLCEEKIMIFN